jgi:lipoprotein-anchoring transpeptidase ErfK/SrfK
MVEPWAIGSNILLGCICLLNEDMMVLFDQMPTGTRIIVMKQLSIIVIKQLI